LHQCRVGLGGKEFPTPVGIYYVTHIYDDEPWWIPPKNRAWAAGQSPSKKVYGGTMAPLLKKRPGRFKKQAPDPEDMIESQVQLNDDGYRFHGTNQPRSIGHNQSHGCVRMIPDDAKKVASLIKKYVGEAEQQQSENGSFVVLKAPVRLNLVK
jgi:lipoprotein-anchoring transpeptidase ErfK/SrfK